VYGAADEVVAPAPCRAHSAAVTLLQHVAARRVAVWDEPGVVMARLPGICASGHAVSWLAVGHVLRQLLLTCAECSMQQWLSGPLALLEPLTHVSIRLSKLTAVEWTAIAYRSAAATVVFAIAAASCY
jgi:hypothetical protein